MRSSFVFYGDWWDVLQELPEKEYTRVSKAIFMYAFSGVVPDDPMVKAITGLMRSAIDRDLEKWQSIREKRIEAGREGGKAKAKQKVANGSKAKQKVANGSKAKHTLANQAVNVNVNVNDNVINKESTNVPKKDELSLPPKNTLTQKQETMLKRKAEFKAELSQFADRYSKDMLNDFYEYWTEPNKSHTKMLFETKQTWDTSRRLSRWERNSRKGGVQ